MKKTIIIIGAGPGLGNHIAEEFGNKGFQVVLMARREETLKNYVNDMKSKGIDVTYQCVDCASNESIEQAIKIILQNYDVDILVYNAAVLKDGLPSKLSTEELLKRYQVDVIGAMKATQLVIPHMLEKGEGIILYTGGGLALDPMPEYTSISVHKAALRALAIAYYKELKDNNIYVGIVNIKGNIGNSDYYSPERIAKLYFELYTKRDRPEIIY